jgi:ATP-dependent DNA helicase DinG
MDFEHRVTAVFEADGSLSRALDFYQPRDGQIQMAGAIARTMHAGGVLAVEAGTGVGKTFAYLVPALLSGERVLVSTATKALQDQLFVRDIPFLKSVLGAPVNVALLKGRASYLCTHRLASTRLDAVMLSDADLLQLSRVELWAMQTHSGDLAEVDVLDDATPLLTAITSTRENCLGSRCPDAATCFVNRARREAMAADLVVVNHHLFFADLNVRESGVAELLPSARTVIFDEAHQLNEIGVQFLGKQLTTGQLDSFAKDLTTLGVAQARGFADWEGIAADLKNRAQNLRLFFQRQGIAGKFAWTQFQELPASLANLQSAFEPSIDALQMAFEIAPEFRAMHDRADQLRAMLMVFCAPLDAASVRWVDVGQEVRLVQSPLDIAEAMKGRVVNTQADAGQGKSWIFTSATLGTDASLSWFVDSCGLQGASTLRVESPFDYATQAGLYVPNPFPKPGDPRHSLAVAEMVLAGASEIGGRTLVLTTTLRAMRSITDTLRTALQGRDDLVVLVQGQMPKRALVEAFSGQHRDAGHDKGVILVASVSFWEGIDIPGDALQLLVIDKLPFAAPDDPVQSARATSLEQKGGNAFKSLHLPHAAVALKQGAGRLIRRESDQGVLAICDVRLATMGYGKRLIQALPAMHRISNEIEFLDCLRRLTRPSTKDHSTGARP